ncbi:MAG: hypothetical protein ACP5HS_08685 [Anaerolineae bacterium]
MDDTKIDASEENPPPLASESQKKSRLLARQAIGLVKEHLEEEDVPDPVKDQLTESVRKLKSVLKSRLADNPTHKMFWRWFQQEPDTDTAPLISAISSLMEDDPDFENEITTLLQGYREERGNLQQAQRETAVITEEEENR